MSTNYEYLLVASFLAAPDLVNLVGVESKSFSDPKVRGVLEAMVAIKDGDLNEMTVCQELQNRKWSQDDAVKVVSILNGFQGDTHFAPTLENAEFYADKINEAYSKRLLARRLAELEQDTHDLTVPLSDNLASIEEILLDMQSGSVDRKDPTSEGIWARMKIEMDKGESPAFSSGFKMIDNATAWGGIKQKHVWLLVAPYKSYKTRSALHICDAALSQGKSVAYYALEDDESSFSMTLMCIHFGIPEKAFEAYRSGEETSYVESIGNAIDWFTSLGSRWRVYDRKWDIANWKRFAPAVAADKRRYGTGLVVVDHLQMWDKDYESMGKISNMVMDVAQKNDVALLIISQVSNDTIKFGSASGQIATKGSGDFGAIAHLGVEIFKDRDKSDFVASPAVMLMLQSQGTDKYLNKFKEVSEIRIAVKAVRRGATPTYYVMFDVYSGKILAEYDQPFVLS
jgi:KaiC/GvpD/RAD55 family RecA-like ATPase